MKIMSEPLFLINNFKQNKLLTNTEAACARFLNLLFMEKGTNRDDFDMGINIQQYLFERATDELLGRINSNIQTQLAKYFPEYPDAQVISSFKKDKESNDVILDIQVNLDKIIDEEGNNTIEFMITTAREIKQMSDIEIYYITT